MPALTTRHRDDCNLPHPGPGFRQWLRWCFSSVRCEGTRRISWLGIGPQGKRDAEQIRLVASQLAYQRGADEFHGVEAHTDQQRARAILLRLGLNPSERPQQVDRVAAQLAYLRGADQAYGVEAHTDQQRARTILSVLQEPS